MKIEQLENKLNFITKVQISIGAFSLIGMGAIFPFHPLLGAISAIGLPLLMTGTTSYRKMKTGSFSSLTSPDFGGLIKNSFNNWCEDYIDNSCNLTEKKYKVLFLTKWMEHRFITPHELFGRNNAYIESLSEQILKANESRHNLSYMFKEWENAAEKLKCKDFFEEDLDSMDKIETAKKIYKDFENLGMLGKSFRFGSIGALPFLAKLQEGVLTKKDVNYINEITQQMSNTHSDFFYVSGIYLMKSDEGLIKNMLDNNEDKEVLKTLENFFLNVEFKLANSYDLALDSEKIAKDFRRKNDYLNLQEKVEKITLKNLSVKKRKI